MTTASPQSRVGVPEIAQTKVCNDSLPVGLVQQDVIKLAVAVLCSPAQPRQDLSEEEPGLLQLEALLASNHDAEIASRVKVKAVEVADETTRCKETMLGRFSFAMMAGSLFKFLET